MLANTKKELKAYLENNEPEDSASFTYEPILPIIREDNRIQEITSTEDLIFLASQVLDVNEIYHFDLLLGALVKWDRQQEAKQISQWTPILQRAYKLLMSGGSSRNGILDQLMATFLLDYAKLLIKRFPEEAQELNNLHLKMVQKDELQKGKWGYRNLQKLTIREKTNKKIKFPVHKQLLCRTLDLLESKEKPLPLLSTPTHTPMFIAPETLIERLVKTISAGKCRTGRYGYANSTFTSGTGKFVARASSAPPKFERRIPAPAHFFAGRKRCTPPTTFQSSFLVDDGRINEITGNNLF